MADHETLDARLDRATLPFRADDPDALARILDRTRAKPSAAPVRLRFAAGALTAVLAGALLLPRGESGRAEASMGFAQVQAATRNAPHSIARSFDARGRATGYVVYRDGAKYAALLPDRGGKRFLSETRGDGRRMMHSFQWEARAEAPRYRYARLDGPELTVEARFDTLAGVLRTHLFEGPAPEGVRVGERIRYRIKPRWSKTADLVVEADVASGRVLEIRSEGDDPYRTVLDYRTPIPANVFTPKPSEPDVVVLDMPRLRALVAGDKARGAGAWLDGGGMLWRVYRGSPSKPPEIPGLRLFGRTSGRAYVWNGVVAVGSRPDRTPPTTVRIAGRTVPVRKIGMIFWWRDRSKDRF